MSVSFTLNENDRVLAGELALRLLSPTDETAARTRASSDPEFAAEVARWEDWLAGLSDGVESVPPSAAVWARIQSEIGVAANDNARVSFWRRWALGSTGLLAASLAAVAILVARPPSVVEAPAAPQTQLTRVATLNLEGQGQAAMTLVYDAATGSLYLAPTQPMAADGRVPHLWLVMPEGGVQLVGAVDGSTASRHHIEGLMSDRADLATAAAISMEAPGHTPAADKPDGPVVASGQLNTL